jgi:chitinase
MRKWMSVVAVAVAGAAVAAGVLVDTASRTPLLNTAKTGRVATAGLGAKWYGSAPYDEPLDAGAPDLGQVMSATGQKAFELAFILAQGGCTPAWGGTDPVSSDTQVGSVIKGIRAKGGDVSAAIGGYNGTKLGQVCGTPAATAAAYQQVISAYGLHAIDLDIENQEIADPTAVNNELGAAQILQRNNPGMYVSVTMPWAVKTYDTIDTSAELNLLKNAKALGFTPDNYTLMPFDGGYAGAPTQITVMKTFNSLLMKTFGWTSATAYAHEGISSMNGRTDQGGYFRQSDFQTMLDFAESNGLSRYTFWSLNRDRACNPPDNQGTTSSSCSSVPQNAYDFTKYTVAFEGRAAKAPAAPPAPTAPPDPYPPTGPNRPTPGSPEQPKITNPPATSGTCAAPWNSKTAYISGGKTSYNGSDWTANQWNEDEAPGGPAGAWNKGSACH